MQEKSSLRKDIKRTITIVLGAFLSMLVLTFSILTIMEVTNKNIPLASLYLLWIFIGLGLTRFLVFILNPSKALFIRFLVLFLVNIAIGVMVYFGKDNSYIFSLAGGIYCTSIVISRIFKIIADRSPRSVIFNVILMVFSALLAVGLFIPYSGYEGDIILLLSIFIAITAFVEAFSSLLSRLKLRVLVKIIFRTFALEIILGLLATMVAFSLILSMYEENIPTFFDGLWYSFAVVTTIGFGDFVAVSLVGRILTVILGIYGIVVVAVITSIIVNFYNETAGKNDAKEMKDIQKEIDKKK